MDWSIVAPCYIYIDSGDGTMSISDLIEQTIAQHIIAPKVLSYAGTKINEVKGRFVSANRVYNFVLDKKGISYSPAGQGDSLLFSGLYLERLDAARKPKVGNDKCNAGKSYQCGKICLGNRRKCHKGVRDVNDARRIASILASTNEKLKGSLEGSDKAIARGKALFEARGKRSASPKAMKSKVLTVNTTQRAKPDPISDEIDGYERQIKDLAMFLGVQKRWKAGEKAKLKKSITYYQQKKEEALERQKKQSTKTSPSSEPTKKKPKTEKTFDEFLRGRSVDDFIEETHTSTPQDFRQRYNARFSGEKITRPTKEKLMRVSSYYNPLSKTPVLTSDEYAALFGEMTTGVPSDASLHRGDPTTRSHQQLIRMTGRFADYASAARSAIKKEFAEKVAKGGFREPTRLENLLLKSKGSEDHDATHASRNLLAKRGIDYKTAKLNSQGELI